MGGVVGAGQSVLGGGINAVTGVVEGVAATPGSILSTVGLMEEEKTELEGDLASAKESLGGWVAFAVKFLPQSVKDMIAMQQSTLHNLVFQ